jgi:hypothetical protein
VSEEKKFSKCGGEGKKYKCRISGVRKKKELKEKVQVVEKKNIKVFSGENKNKRFC